MSALDVVVAVLSYRHAAERVRRFATAVCACALCACAGDPGPERAGAVFDTLPGGAVRVRGPADGVWEEDAAWRLIEDVRIGRREGTGPDVFGNVWAVQTDAYGRMYVVDRIAKAVRVFAPSGEYVRTLGRAGQGPGEFENPFGLAWDAHGNLWVMDVDLRRYSVFDTAGNHVREYRRQVGGYSWPWPGRFDRQGLLYEPHSVAGDTVTPLIAFRPEEELVAVDTFPQVFARDPELGLEPLEGALAFWDLRNEQGLGSVVGIPFLGEREWVLDGEGHVWIANGSRYVIHKRDLGGRTLLVLERNVEPPPVSTREREAAIEELGEHATHPRMDLSRIPDTKAFFEQLIPGPDGALWVLRQGVNETWFFDVFAGDGRFLGSVDLPLEPDLYPPPHVGRDAVVAVTHDALDLAYVVRFRIVRPETRVDASPGLRACGAIRWGKETAFRRHPSSCNRRGAATRIQDSPNSSSRVTVKPGRTSPPSIESDPHSSRMSRRER